MNENAVFVDTVHFLCSYLKLNRRAVRTNHCRVQTLVAVRLRDSNKVLKTRMNGFETAMKGSKREIAVVKIFHDESEAVNVKRVRKGLVLFTHLVVDAVNGFVTTKDSTRNAGFEKCSTGVLHHLFEEFAASLTRFQNIGVENFVAEGVAVGERKFLQFAEHIVKS